MAKPYRIEIARDFIHTKKSYSQGKLLRSLIAPRGLGRGGDIHRAKHCINCMPAVHASHPCKLRIFLYAHLVPNQTSLLSEVAPLFGDCLASPCPQFESFTSSSALGYTSDVPLYNALIRRCRRTRTAADADLFVVPLLFGTIIASAWEVGRRSTRRGNYSSANYSSATLEAAVERHNWPLHGNAARMCAQLLTHLTPATAHKHLFLWTMNAALVLPTVRGLPKPLRLPIQQAIFVHLGDDHWRSRPTAIDARQKLFGYMPRDMIVPYRISHWLPFGFPPTPGRLRPLLLFANVDFGRHIIRRQFVAAIARRAAQLNISHRISMSDPTVRCSSEDSRKARGAPGRLCRTALTGVRYAATQSLSSVFCLCPTGDTKGLTARFYFSILHGCIPVRVDGWRRNYSMPPPPRAVAHQSDESYTAAGGASATPAARRGDVSRSADGRRHSEVALPFPSIIDWASVLINADPRQPGRLLATLLAIPLEDIRERQRVMRSIAPLMLVDDLSHGSSHGPPQANGVDAFVAELHALAGVKSS